MCALNVWDVAALEVIVREAGGKVTGFAGEPYPESRITSKADDGSFCAPTACSTTTWWSD